MDEAWGRNRHGGIVRLARTVTDDRYAGPLRRDLLCDNVDFDELGWRGLADYLEYAPPGTAIFHARTHGVTLTDQLISRLIHEVERLTYYFRRANFVGELEYPEMIILPGMADAAVDGGPSWSDVKNPTDLMSPKVRALMRGE